MKTRHCSTLKKTTGVHAELPYQTGNFSVVLLLESSPGLGKCSFGKFQLAIFLVEIFR